LYRDCCVSSLLTHRDSGFGRAYTERDLLVEYSPSESETDTNTRPAFLDCSGLSWYRMQVCDPPITMARLHFTSGEKAAWGQPEGGETEDIYTTIYDRDGITMGLVYDTAAATLRPRAGNMRNDPEHGWNFHLTFGFEHNTWSYVDGSDESDFDLESDDEASYRSQDDGGEETGAPYRFDIEEIDADEEG